MYTEISFLTMKGLCISLTLFRWNLITHMMEMYRNHVTITHVFHEYLSYASSYYSMKEIFAYTNHIQIS